MTSSMLNLKNNAESKLKLTEAQRRMYAAEKQENFRWISKLVATYSPYELSDNDLIPTSEINFIREIGQFAEVVYSAIPIEQLLANYDIMNQPKFPLEGYYALSPHKYTPYATPFQHESSSLWVTSTGLKLIKSFKGTIADLPVAIFSRWITETQPKDMSSDQALIRNQTIVSICGTSTMKQAFHDLRAIRTIHPCSYTNKTSSSPQPNEINANLPTVHSGFWSLYQGINADALQAIQEALILPPPSDLEIGETVMIERELIVTGHSMGGALAHLLAIDLISPLVINPSQNINPKSSVTQSSWLPSLSLLLNPLKYAKPISTPKQLTSKEPQSINDKPTISESLLHKHSIKTLHIITFGEPRAGNQALVDHWTHLKTQDESSPYKIQINEWCVKGYNDGVPALPPTKLGYRHFSHQPLYTMNNKTYRVPSSEKEHALFRIRTHQDHHKSSGSSNNDNDNDNDNDNNNNNNTTTTSTDHKKLAESLILYPLGGHNYYNERDLEGGFLRRIEWLMKSGFDGNGEESEPELEGREGWKERYLVLCSK